MDQSGEDQGGATAVGDGVDELLSITTKLTQVAQNIHSISDHYNQVVNGEQPPIYIAPPPTPATAAATAPPEPTAPAVTLSPTMIGGVLIALLGLYLLTRR